MGMDDLIPITMGTAGLFLMWSSVKNRKPHKVLQAVLTGNSWDTAEKIAGDNPIDIGLPGLPNLPNVPGIPNFPDPGDVIDQFV